MTFEPVWVSNESHLRQFGEILATGRHQLLGRRYSIPEGFPCIALPSLFRSNLAPIVYYSCGKLDVDETGVRFTAAKRIGWMKRGNIDVELHFAIPRGCVSVVEWRAASPAALQYYSMPFIRVRATGEHVPEDLLICVSGRGPSMRKIRNETERLYAALQSFKRT